MFWETISALIFLVILSVFWFPLSVVWGIAKFFLTLVFGVISAFKGSMSESALVALPLQAVISGFDAFLDIPVWMWDWAKFSHPWWALIISLVVLGMMNSK